MKRGSPFASPGGETPPPRATPPPPVSSPSPAVPPEIPPNALQPLTPRGVAGFASGTLNRLCGFQVAFAFLSGLVLAWFLGTSILPAVRALIEQLPDEGSLESGTLRIPSLPADGVVVERSWLAVMVDLDQTARSSTGHALELRLTRSGIQLCTGVGCGFIPYGKEWSLSFGRLELRPWWDAWQPVMLAGSGFALIVFLLSVWWILATLYCVVPRVTAFFADRALNLPGAWKLSAAALLPGAVIMVAGILGLGLGWIDPVRWVLVVALHMVIPLAYLVVSPLYLPRREAARAALSNPFDSVPAPTSNVAAPPATPVDSTPGETSSAPTLGASPAAPAPVAASEGPVVAGPAADPGPGEEIPVAARSVNPFAAPSPASAREIRPRSQKPENPFAPR